MGESWIVSNLNAALSTWNDKLAEIWSLLTESPQTFKGGQVWGVMTGIHGALQAIGYGLLVLFFAVGVMKTCGSFVEVKKPEHALKLFIRFALAKGTVTYGLELMLAVFSIVQGMVSTIITQSGSSGMSSVSLPQELIDAINNVGFWDSIPLWAVTLIGGLLITVLSFTMILTVYGRMFSLWMYVGTEEIGWMCILGAAPFAACGFFTYHGMTAEQVLWAWFKSEILCPKRLVFKSDSYYYEAMQPAIRAGIKRKRGLPMKKNTHTSEETA